jgi:hypothetical protein
VFQGQDTVNRQRASDEGGMWALKILAARTSQKKEIEEQATGRFIEVFTPVLVTWAYQNQDLGSQFVSEVPHDTEMLPSIICYLVFGSGALDRVLDRLDQFDPSKGDFNGWAYTLVTNFWLDGVRKHNRREKHEVKVEEDDNEEWLIGLSEGIFAAAQPENPEDVMLEGENEKEIKNKLKALYEKVKNKPDLRELVDAMINGSEYRPRFLAVILKTSVQDINNRFKRLRRLGL